MFKKVVLLITGYPNIFCPSLVAIGPQGLSRIRPTVWCAALAKCFFLQRFTRHHMARTTWCRSLCDCYHRFFRHSGGSNGASPVPIRQPVPVPGAKILEQTHIQTHPNLFYLAHHCRLNAKSSYHIIGAFITIGRHCIYRTALCQNRKFLILLALSGFEPTKSLHLTWQSCRCLSDLNGVLPAPIGPSVRAQKPK